MLASLIQRYNVTISSQQSRDRRQVARYLSKETCRRQNYHQQISTAVGADAGQHATRHRHIYRHCLVPESLHDGCSTHPHPGGRSHQSLGLRPSCALPLSSFSSQSLAVRQSDDVSDVTETSKSIFEGVVAVAVGCRLCRFCRVRREVTGPPVGSGGRSAEELDRQVRQTVDRQWPSG